MGSVECGKGRSGVLPRKRRTRSENGAFASEIFQSEEVIWNRFRDHLKRLGYVAVRTGLDEEALA
jgi:hypothetical protein